MSTKTVAPAATIHITESGRQALKLYEQEIATYLRELPRLLAEGQAWRRHVLVKGNEILGIWGTQGEALEDGRDRFGIEPIFVKTIDPRDSERFALLDARRIAVPGLKGAKP